MIFRKLNHNSGHDLLHDSTTSPKPSWIRKSFCLFKRTQSPSILHQLFFICLIPEEALIQFPVNSPSFAQVSFNFFAAIMIKRKFAAIRPKRATGIRIEEPSASPVPEVAAEKETTEVIVSEEEVDVSGDDKGNSGGDNNSDEQANSEEQASPNTAPLMRRNLAKFPTAEAWDFFKENIKRTFIVERAMGNINPEYVQKFNWLRLLKGSTFGSPDLVREFYANFDPEEPYTVFVRKTNIDITLSTIAKHLGVHEFSGNHELALEKIFPGGEKALAKAINRNLCDQHTVRWTKKGDKYICFSATALKEDYKAWHKFVCCTLMPTTATHMVQIKRALVLLAIHLGVAINLPQLMINQMIRCVTDGKVQSWYFPKFITTLCMDQGVHPLPTEGKVQETRKITTAGISRLPPTPAKGSASTSAAKDKQKGKEKVDISSEQPAMSTIQQLQQQIQHLSDQLDDLEKRNHERYEHLHNHYCVDSHITACRVAGLPDYIRNPIPSDSEEDEQDDPASSTPVNPAPSSSKSVKKSRGA